MVRLYVTQEMRWEEAFEEQEKKIKQLRELLRRCASHLSFILADYSEFGAVYHPNVSEITDLIDELAKELGDAAWNE